MFLHVATRRWYSTIKPKRTPTFRDLFRTPVFKSLLMTLIFGSAVVEATKNRKELEALRATYNAKFQVLRNITERVNNKEPVDVAAELKLANALTRNRYNSVTDVEMDHQLEAFLKMADEEPTDLFVREKGNSESSSAHAIQHEEPSRNSSQFL